MISSNRLRLCGLVCRRVKTNVMFGWKRYARGQWIGRPFPARWRPQYPLCREEGFAAADGWESSTGGGIFAPPLEVGCRISIFFCFWQILRLMQTDTRCVADGNSGQARNQYVPDTMAGIAMYNGDRSGGRDGDKRHRRYPSLCCPVIMRSKMSAQHRDRSRRSKSKKQTFENQT